MSAGIALPNLCHENIKNFSQLLRVQKELNEKVTSQLLDLHIYNLLFWLLVEHFAIQTDLRQKSHIIQKTNQLDGGVCLSMKYFLFYSDMN